MKIKSRLVEKIAKETCGMCGGGIQFDANGDGECQHCGAYYGKRALKGTSGKCPDCGEPGELKGHMGCQYPQD